MTFAINGLDDRTLITDFIDKRIICGDLIVDKTNISKVATVGLKTTGVIISALGKVPFISINLKLKRFGLFRYFLAAGNSLGFCALGSWSTIHIIDEIFQSLTPEEKRLFKNRLNCLSKTISIASALLLSISSQAVIAYLAYTYNNENLLMALAIMLSDTSFPFYSTYLSTQKILEKHSFTEIEKKLNKMKEAMSELLSTNTNKFIGMKPDEKNAYLEDLDRIKRKYTKEERLDEYLSMILKETPEVSQTKVEKYGNTFFGLNGAHFTLNHMALLGFVSYIGGSLLTSSKIGGVVAASITILSNIYLEGTSLIKTSQKAFNGLYNFVTGRHNSTVSEQLSPKLSFSLKTLGLLISFLAWGPGVQVSEDYIDNIGYRTYTQIASSLAVVLLISTAILGIIDELVEIKVKKDSKEAKNILEINEKMKRLIEVIRKSPFKEFLRFTKFIPEETLSQLKDKCRITQSELDEYIEKNKLLEDEECVALLG